MRPKKQNDHRYPYRRESELVHDLADALAEPRSELRSSASLTEFPHPTGRTDLIAKSSCGDLIAFETKLLNWKRAVQQAYRNSSFAHYSYVVVPPNVAERAVISDREFLRRKVGLCTIREGRITIAIPAPRQEPLLPWVTELANCTIGV